MLIEIHLGCGRFGENEPIVIRTLATKEHAEFNPDDIFDSMQRIGGHYPEQDHEQCDLDRIEAKYQGSWATTLLYARKAMARRGAPSMSVGDKIIVSTSPADDGKRTRIVEYVCKPMGWETRAPAPAV